MLVSFLKFMACTLASALVMIWTTSPDLWSCVSHTFHHVGSNPSQFEHMFENLLGQAQNILVISENVVRSLTCDDLKLSALETVPSMPLSLAPSVSLPSEVLVNLDQGESLGIQEHAPKRATWLLDGMIFMGLDSVMNDISILVLKTQELNPSSLKADLPPERSRTRQSVKSQA
ncbi:hypothetical protein DSO57_1034659 [Entomophthora muscae]|uniref:Uncharacterized protein n=1 Tax=Entomophthora muscae TaxID=34485 RepID=A0ACC2TY84_9FUNG|nr:hypothetical protein DSO57_1034659 [Entomophthora muscae]